MKYVYKIKCFNVLNESISVYCKCLIDNEDKKYYSNFIISVYDYENDNLTDYSLLDIYDLVLNNKDYVEGISINKLKSNISLNDHDVLSVRVTICTIDRKEIQKLVMGKLLNIGIDLDGTITKITKNMVVNNSLVVPNCCVRFKDIVDVDKSVTSDMLSSIKSIEFPRSTITSICKSINNSAMNLNIKWLISESSYNIIDFSIISDLIRVINSKSNSELKDICIKINDNITVDAYSYSKVYNLESSEIINTENFSELFNRDVNMTEKGVYIFKDRTKNLVLDFKNKSIVRKDLN